MTGERAELPRHRERRGRIFRIVGSILVGAFVAALLGIMTAPGVLRNTSPAIAVSVAPWDGRTTALMAQQTLVGDRHPASLRRALDLSKSAYRRDPTAIRALTSAGMAVALMGRTDDVAPIFTYAERLSRRDEQTQMWLIEERVAANDIAGALRHYDTALRVSKDVQPILFPVLANAASDDAIARDINRLLRSRPLWWREFIDAALSHSNDAEALATVTTGLLDPADDRDRPRAARLVAKLSGLRRFDLVWNVYEDMAPQSGRALIRNGDFEEDQGLPPLDWDFADESELNPERGPSAGQGGGFALYLPTSASADGEVARQLLHLPPGSYEFGAEVGETPVDPLRRPFVSIVCATNARRGLLRADFPVATDRPKRLRAAFSVPPGCAFQWISIHAQGSLDEALPMAPWIASVSLRRI